MLRSLIYFWRTHLAVLLGAAVAATVLTGALLVGDSVRGSLRDLVLDRLGRIDSALATSRLFDSGLAERIEARAGRSIVPGVLLRATAVEAESGSRAAGVTLLGVDDRFSRLYPETEGLDFSRRDGQIFPSVILNQALADQLGAAAGDEIVLSFERPTEVHSETLVGRADAEDLVESLRLSVTEVIPDRGVGGFALTAHQTRPLNAFAELSRVQRALDRRGEANLLLAAEANEEVEVDGDLPSLNTVLHSVTEVEDLGLVLRSASAGEAEPEDEVVVVESQELVLAPEIAAKVEKAAEAVRGVAQPVLSYLANSIAVAGSGESVPYSTVAALDPPVDPLLGRLTLVDGSPAPPLAADEILLGRWAADDLGIAGEAIGEAGADPISIELTYYVLGARDELSTETSRLRLAGVVAQESLGADPTLTPELPGLSDAENMSAWDPPFPVDLGRIRPRDEAYWDDYRAAPKAFISLATGQRLWKSRFGDVTSVRVAGVVTIGDGDPFRAELTAAIQPEEAGLQFRPIRAEGLAAASGATDFSGLFIGFSSFLIVAAALLVGLLFRLGAEQRSREIGLLLAVGYRLETVRRRLMTEGGLLAAAGALLGLGGAVAYAGLMLMGLRTWWLPAVGAPVLFLHVSSVSLAIGWVIAVGVVLVSIALAVRRLYKVPAPALLGGELTAGSEGGRPVKKARWIAIGALVLGLGLAVAALFGDASSSPGLAFGIGACLLIAGLALFSAWSRRGARSRAGASSLLRRSNLWGMASRNSARNPGRSLLSVALVACASFVIVTVAANRGQGEQDVTAVDSGTGGFSLVAESDIALTQNLDSPEARSELGVPAASEAVLEGASVYPLRLLPGEDASCLNLFQPTQPRILGVPGDFVERGGFRFKSLAAPAEGEGEPDNPWTLLEEEIEPRVVPAFADYNSAMWILHLGLGDELVYEGESGDEVRLRLVGLLDRSLFQGEVLISEAAFERHFPSRAGYGYFLIATPPERTDEVSTALEAGLGRFGFDATTTADKLAAFSAVEQTYLSTFQALGGLGLILGTIGLGIVLLRSVLERRGELATLRAFGYRRRRLTAMVVAENAFLLLVGLAIGTVSALVAVAPHLAVSAGHVPWLSLGATLAGVFVVGLLASIAAVAGTARIPLLPALKSE